MFLQIGDRAIAIEHIVYVYFAKDRVGIELDVLDGDSPSVYVLKGNDHKAFLKWWEHKADVYKAY